MEEKTLDEHIDMLRYFWEEKEDIERYSDFEYIKSDLEKYRPDILKAWNKYKVSKLTLNNLLRS